MPTYSGRLEGPIFNFIAVDKFNKAVVSGASVFFLTHYHTDHFEGLRQIDWEREEVTNIFKRNPEKKLYCSTLTKRLFISDDPNRIPENQIVGLEAGEVVVVAGHAVDGSESVFVTVTAIPSGHILGAVMFLFEHENERVLFTGDFRIHKHDIPKLTALHHRDGNVKALTQLYLDTTFGYPKYLTFPLRSDIASIALKLIKDWFALDYMVHIDLPYKFAFERLLIDISKGSRCKIAIEPSDYRSYYAFIPEFDGVVFPAYRHSVKDNPKIHALKNNRKNCQFCSEYPISKVKIIRPCAMTFTKSTLSEGLINREFSDGSELIRVPYATHCSLEELQAFVRYYSSKEIFTIVNHKPDEYELVKEHVLFLLKTAKTAVSSKDQSDDLKLNSNIIPKYESSDESDEEYHTPLMDSPPF